MSKPVIKVDELSKIYRLGQIGTGTLSHDLKRWWAVSRGKQDPYLKIGMENDRTQKAQSDYAWALRDISFEVQKGDTLGIIGRNGAGKSTLLKILSRITTPTQGRMRIKGKIASLLEVGTGFHPEMTGKENIYMNGAILGMTRSEITKKMDEIVDFAGISMYVDTPVKRYSSGMYVRLAFAVASSLDSDILIVDEVLAVGDSDFQKKCLGKMSDISQNQGKTVLFVSHNIYTVSEICNKGLLLVNGTLGFSGSIKDTIANYMVENAGVGEVFVTHKKGIEWEGILNKAELNELRADDDISFVLGFRTTGMDFHNIMIDFNLFNENNENVIHSRSNWVDFRFSVKQNTRFNINYKVKSPKLSPGKYYLTIFVCQTGQIPLLHIDFIEAFTVTANNYFGTSRFFDMIQSSTVPEYTISQEIREQ
jgi:lipopolysaccharide transport system ATP-binding protein